MLTFGSQSRNAQMAYNNSFVLFSSVVDGSRKNVPLTRVQDVWGPGAEAILVRNFLSVMSVRSLSPWLQERLPSMRGKAALCDVGSSLVMCTMTAPVHQLFNFLATTPEAKSVSLARRANMARRFLREQYFVPLPREVMITDFSQPPPSQHYSWRISPVALRDFGSAPGSCYWCQRLLADLAEDLDLAEVREVREVREGDGEPYVGREPQEAAKLLSSLLEAHATTPTSQMAQTLAVIRELMMRGTRRMSQEEAHLAAQAANALEEWLAEHWGEPISWRRRTESPRRSTPRRENHQTPQRHHTEEGEQVGGTNFTVENTDYQKGTTIADGGEHMREPAVTSSKNDGGTEKGEDKGWICCFVPVTEALVVV
ncbi:DPOL [Symbiodinium natans]|uniref:DPOL protein n=1 Tax=Symbiodinium natans TaxID=878477 RepID=A0A812SNI2_9DINO|nr:DPOL [Symbiodinium natans]